MFSEDVTVLANWQAKTTNITLDSLDGNGGDKTCIATYGLDMPDITVPNKDGYDFLGYFNASDVKYYDAYGKSAKVWDKEDVNYELVAKYEEKQLLSNPVSNDKITITIDLDEGTLLEGAPTGWQESDGNYTKQFDSGVYYWIPTDEWRYVTIEKPGFVAKDVDYWEQSPIGWAYTFTSDYTFKVTYNKVINVTVNNTDHCTVERKSSQIIDEYINSSINNLGNAYLYQNGNTIAEITSIEAGYAFDYWVINGDIVSSFYDVEEDITITPHVSKDLGLYVWHNLVTETNKNDILGDGNVSYDPDNKILTIVGDEGSSYLYVYGVYATDDLKIVTSNNVKIYGSSEHDEQGNYYAIYCPGKLEIESEGKLSLDACTYSTQYIGKELSAIHAKDVVISKGDITIKGSTYGVYASNSFTVDNTNKPTLSIYSDNTIAVHVNGEASNLKLNGANVYGSTGYTADVDSAIYQDGQSEITITYEESDVTLYDLWISNHRVTSENCDNIDGYGSYKYDPDKNTLYLSSTVYGEARYGYGIYCKDDLNIYVEDGWVGVYGNSSAIYSTGTSYGIYCEGDLSISGKEGSTMDVSGASAQTISCGIFCDGRLTISIPIDAYSGSVEYIKPGKEECDEFCISAGVWARGGIEINGSDKTKQYLRGACGDPINVHYNSYGILSGDGNPGYCEEATINVKNAKVLGEISYGNNNESAYCIFSYGTITFDKATLDCKVNGISLKDNVGIHSEEDLVFKNESIIDTDLEFDLYNWGSNYRKFYFIETEGTTTIDNSKVIIKSGGWGSYYTKTKKSHTIHTENLVIKNSAVVDVAGFDAYGGESVGIYVKEKLDIQGGTITAAGGKSTGDDSGSYGIYAGSNSFDGAHSISGGTIIASAGESEYESVGLKTKKGNLNITGGTFTLSGEDKGLSVSEVLTVSRTSNDASPKITASSNTQTAVYSKEPLVLNNAVLENINGTYVPEETSKLMQSDDNPVIIRYKQDVTVTGLAPVYPQGETSYTYGDTVTPGETPTVKLTLGGQTSTVTGLTKDDFTYDYYAYDETQSKYKEEKMTAAPIYAGKYKLVASIKDSNLYYVGKQEAEFTIGKKDLTAGFDEFYFDYDGENAYAPTLVISGLVNEDTYNFVENNPIYKYDGSSETKPIKSGTHTVSAELGEGKIVIKHGTTDVTKNYDVDALANKTYAIEYYIVYEDEKDEKEIEEGVFVEIYSNPLGNSESVKDIKMNKLDYETAKKIAGDGTVETAALLEALNKESTIHFFTELDNVKDETAFEEKGINASNAVLFSVGFFYSIDGGEKKPITDLNEQKITITITILGDEVKRIVGNNKVSDKNFYVLRKHGETVDNKINCEVVNYDKTNECYEFMFESDKFSDFALISENKPSSPTRRPVPNTGAY